MYTQMSVNELVENAALLDNQAFRHFLADVFNRRARQETPALDKQEADLLKKINAGFPEDQWKRLDSLDTQLEDATLSEQEHAELTALTHLYEQYMLRRLKYLGKLAELRKTTLSEVMRQLGIRHESDV